MTFDACLNCKYKDKDASYCWEICDIPFNIVNCVEEYFNNTDYPEDLELDLYEIAKKGKKT